MKVLHVIPSYIPAYRYGGPVKAVHELCVALAKKGIDVSVFTTNIDLEKRLSVVLNEQQDIEGVKVTYYPVKFPASYCYSPGLGRAVESETDKFDMVHIHSVFLYPTYVTAYWCRKKRIPYIVNPFGALDPDMIKLKSRLVKNMYINIIERVNIEHAKAVHVTSRYEKKQFISLGFNVPVVIIPRGLNLKDYIFPEVYKDLKESNPHLKGKKLILFLGRIHPKKGLDLLVKGFKKVIDKRKDAYLVIAGPDEDNYASRIKEMLKRLALSEYVLFTDMLLGNKKMSAFYSSDIFILSSYGENFGITILEAMACKLAVVVSNKVGLYPDVKEYNAGIVVDCNPSDIADAILGLLEREDLRKSMGENGLRLVKERFTWDKIATDMVSAYTAVLDRKTKD